MTKTGNRVALRARVTVYLLLLGLVSAGLILWWPSPTEPMYRGKSASVWANEAMTRGNGQGSMKAFEKLGYRPFYLEAAAGVTLCRIDHQAPAVVPKFLDRLKHSEEQVKMIYVQALGDIGTNAQSAIPELAVFIRDERYVNRKGFNLDLQDAAQDALAKIEGKMMRAK